MFKLNNLSIRPKLVTAFILTGILPLLITGYYGSILANRALEEKSFSQMASVQDIRTNLIETVFAQRFQDLQKLSGSTQVLEPVIAKGLKSMCRGSTASPTKVGETERLMQGWLM